MGSEQIGFFKSCQPKRSALQDILNHFPRILEDTIDDYFVKILKLEIQSYTFQKNNRYCIGIGHSPINNKSGIHIHSPESKLCTYKAIK